MYARRILLAAGALAAACGANAANHEVRIIPFVGFEPVSITVSPGDTVTWRNDGGLHNVVADDNSFSNGAPSTADWVYTRTFDTPGVKPYYCATHGAAGGVGMSGEVRVVAATNPFTINEGVQGSWLNNATGGQGVFFDVMPAANNLFAMAWFTWTTAGGQYDWLTAVGSFAGDTAQMQVFRSRGGRFNAADAVTNSPVGTASVTFASCTQATLTFNLTDPTVAATIPLTRLLPASAICVSANPSTVSP